MNRNEDSILTPQSGQRLGQCWVVDRTAVDVSLLWSELQSGELVEGSILVELWSGGCDVISDVISQVEVVSGPCDAHWSRVETSHMTDQNVGHAHFSLVFGEDAAVRFNCRHKIHIYKIIVMLVMSP